MESVDVKALEIASEGASRKPPGEGTEVSAPVAGVDAADRSATARIVAKNTLWLIGGQLVGMPLTVLVNAVMARRLGAEDYGLLFLVITMAGFAGTFSEFGQSGASQRAIARERAAAGMLVSSALSLRMMAFAVAHVVLGVSAWLLAYQPVVLIGLVIASVHTFLLQFGSTAALAARAFERSDFVAKHTLFYQLASAGLALPVLFLGGGLLQVLVAYLCAGAAAAWLDWRLLKRLGIRLKRPVRAVVRLLAKEGLGFLFLSGVIVLQWNINVVMLSKMTDAEDMGWYAASQRLVGFLIFPCAAVTASLYPTLCRLLAESQEEALRTARTALQIVSWIGLPMAIGCGLFPDIGIQIFSQESFGPAESNLRVAALTVFILYFVMTLATYLNSLGLQRTWALLQLGSVCVSSVLNLAFVPLFRAVYGNGGLGVVTATLVSEALLVVGGLWIAPRGILDRAYFRSLGWALLSGLGMIVVGASLRELTSSWVAAPLAICVYLIGLRWTGILNSETLATLKDMLRRRQA